jgi:hypothetical protein
VSLLSFRSPQRLPESDPENEAPKNQRDSGFCQSFVKLTSSGRFPASRGTFCGVNLVLMRRDNVPPIRTGLFTSIIPLMGEHTSFASEPHHHSRNRSKHFCAHLLGFVKTSQPMMSHGKLLTMMFLSIGYVLVASAQEPGDDKRTVSFVLSVSRTITATKNITKKGPCNISVSQYSGNTTLKADFHSDSCLATDATEVFRLNVESLNGVHGTGTIASSSSGTAETHHIDSQECGTAQCPGDVQKSSSAATGSCGDLTSFAFSYDKKKKRGDFSLFMKLDDEKTISSGSFYSKTGCEPEQSGDARAAAKGGLHMTAAVDGQFLVCNFVLDTMLQRIADEQGRGGLANIVETTSGYELSYSYSKTISNPLDESREYEVSGKDEWAIATTIRLSIGTKPTQYVAVIEPVAGMDGYKQWIPEGGKPGSGDYRGNKIDFRVYVAKKGEPDVPITNVKYKIDFYLRDVSHEPGICLNYPSGDELNSQPDLQFDSLLQQYNGGVYKADHFTSRMDNSPFEIPVVSYDYAAFGKLEVEVTLENTTALHAFLKGDPSITSVTIPYDANGNQIADAWEKSQDILSKNYPADWDEDPLPADVPSKGDGLSLFEEYRGMVINDEKGKQVHQRFHPKTMEVFYHIDGRLYEDYYRLGAKKFTEISGIKIYEIRDKELMGEENGGKFHQRQLSFHHGKFHLQNTDAVCIITYGDNGIFTKQLDPLPEDASICPEQVDYIHMSIPDLTDWGWDLYSVVQKFPDKMPMYLAADSTLKAWGRDPDFRKIGTYARSHKDELMKKYIIFTLIHELGHSVGSRHHKLDEYKGGDPMLYFTQGDEKCPTRYWSVWGLLPKEQLLFQSGLFNPAEQSPFFGAWHFCQYCRDQIHLKMKN